MSRRVAARRADAQRKRGVEAGRGGSLLDGGLFVWDSWPQVWMARFSCDFCDVAKVLFSNPCFGSACAMISRRLLGFWLAAGFMRVGFQLATLGLKENWVLKSASLRNEFHGSRFGFDHQCHGFF